MKLSLGFLAAALCASAAISHAAAAQTPAPQATATPPAQAQSPAAGQPTAERVSVEGEWRGTLEIAGVGKLRLVVKLKRQAGRLVATLDSPDQGANDLPLADVTYADRVLRFVLETPGAPGVYEGALSNDGAEIEGYWSQGGARRPLNLTRAGASSAAQATTPQAFARGRVQLRACAKQGVSKNALCGKYEVFEDRAAKAGRKISLNIVMLPALAEKPAPDPIFYFAGGPGAAASMYAGAPFMTRLRQHRDVVMVDQRGTGESSPLRCDFYGDASNMNSYFGETFRSERVSACRAELEKVADLKLYTTHIAMADLDEVREAMGYDKINVNGGSYGSTAALAYLRLYPQRVRAAAVSGVAPVDYKMALPFAKGVEHALDRLFSDCAADAGCGKAFPNLRQEFSEVVARLAKAPATFEATNPFNQQKQRITMTREGFMEHIRAALYLPDVMNYLPLLIHDLAGGDYSRFASISYQVFRQLDEQIARGMHLSVVCSESIPFITEEEIKRETAGTFYGEARIRAYQRACGLWQKGDVPASFRDTKKLDVPVLMISGDFDPVTPPFVGASALAQYTQGKQVLVHNGTHSSYECTERLMAEFFDRGTWQGLDTACVDQIQRLPFFTPPPAAPK
ncbi:MAG TPA: alpha/beta fold hydrolase [Pyrinomonadaceae bacterium]|jgi:pimeloyl-ACP methyl ester carboxylesterase|nr:alpha/beta fold hydrolase [Pyrinomonadaceae bacterium]